MTTLIVTLPIALAGTATLFHYVVSPDGQQVGESGCGPADLLPALRSTVERVAVVPVQQLSWHAVQLPKGILGRPFFFSGNTAQLRTALEGLLEEQLLDEPALLHFAIAPQAQPEAPVWVAVCSKAWLQGALHLLEQCGHPVNRIVPALAPDALPISLYVVGTPEDAQLVFPQQGGMAVWPASRDSVQRLHWPASDRLVAEPAVAELAEHLFDRQVVLLQEGQQRVQAALSNWDLAQFDLMNSSRTRTWKRLATGWNGFASSPRWRPVRLGLLALLAINLLGLNVWAWQEQAHLKAQRLAINAVLTRTFPSVQVVVDAPVQMERALQALQQASGTASGRDLETMLGVLGAVAPNGMAPTAIDFVASELRLKGLKFTAEDAKSLSFKLKPHGYGASAQDDRLVITQGANP